MPFLTTAAVPSGRAWDVLSAPLQKLLLFVIDACIWRWPPGKAFLYSLHLTGGIEGPAYPLVAISFSPRHSCFQEIADTEFFLQILFASTEIYGDET